MASFTLLIWPLCALVIGRNLPFGQALIWGLLAPYMVLPETYAINLPALPDLDKMMSISLGLMLIYASNRASLKTAPAETEAPVLRLLLLVALIMTLTAPLLTVLNNREALRFGPNLVPGLPIRDSISMILVMALMLVPYYFGRRYLNTPEAHRQLLVALVLSGLFYSLLMLVEKRLSPQLHYWTYGFYQHSFIQHVRDGYRPMVFLRHGLFVGFFVFTCLMAALGLWKAGHGVKWLLAAAWLFFILLISENLGATVIAILLVAVVLGTGRWMQILVAMGIAFVVFLYPIFRGAGWIPVERISAMAAQVSEARSRSLEFRLRNEDISLERAMEKPLTGWGRWGRNQVYNEDGEIISLQEGVWIQAITETGWYGYLGLFGLLTLPAMFAIGVWRRKVIPPETFALMAVTTGNLIYMIPTTCLTPLGWMTFGALAGFMLTRSEEVMPETGPDPSVVRRSRYTRFADRRMRGRSGIESVHRRPTNALR